MSRRLCYFAEAQCAIMRTKRGKEFLPSCLLHKFLCGNYNITHITFVKVKCVEGIGLQAVLVKCFGQGTQGFGQGDGGHKKDPGQVKKAPLRPVSPGGQGAWNGVGGGSSLAQ